MKTEPTTNAALANPAQRLSGNRSSALAALEGDSFGQLLADLRADRDNDIAQEAHQTQGIENDNTTDPAPDAQAWLGIAVAPTICAPAPAAESTANTNDTAAVVADQTSDARPQLPTSARSLLTTSDTATLPRAQDVLASEPQHLLRVDHSVSSAARPKHRAAAAGQALALEGIRTPPAADSTEARALTPAWPERLAAPELAASASVAAVADTSASGLDALAAGERRDASRAAEAAAPGGHASATLDLAGSPSGASTSDPAEFATLLGQALGEAFETLGTQVSLWTAGKTHRASFSVDSGLDDPLSVNIAVTDGVAHLTFRTDDGALRQLIQSQASTTLTDMLARAGLTLGGLDVGGQSASAQGNAPKDARARTTRVGLADMDTIAAQNAERGSAMRFVWRHVGAAGLDVYA